MKQLLIKSVSLAGRCDICHQPDYYDPVMSSCALCDGIGADDLRQLTTYEVEAIEPGYMQVIIQNLIEATPNEMVDYILPPMILVLVLAIALFLLFQLWAVLLPY